MQSQSIKNLIEQFKKLPTVGPKTAQRFVYFLLKNPDIELEKFESAFKEARENIKLCKICFNACESEICPICSNPARDRATICVVEEILDALSIENSRGYNGVYHILGQTFDPRISKLEDLRIKELVERIKKENAKEIILACSPSSEGEVLALYLKKFLDPLEIKITRLGRGLPTGADIEYADPETIKGALLGRQDI
ncbi:MAG: recombination mediator RecR [bacterium]